MSLGWQTESALVPRTAKPINVTNESMMSLKAVVFSKEQNSLLAPKGKTRNLSSKINSHKRDDGRSKFKTEEHDGVGNEDTKIYASLKAKAKIYDQMKAANGNEDFSGVIKHEIALVNFEQKESGHTKLKSKMEPSAPDRLDEFGRIIPPGKRVREDDSRVEKPHMTFKEPRTDNQDPWAWSTGKGASIQNFEEKQSVMREFEGRVERQVQSELATESKARVQTQWEKALNNSARAHLDAVHSQTQIQRALLTGTGQAHSGGAEGSLNDDSNTGEGKKSAKESRREMLRKKQEDLKRGKDGKALGPS